MLPKLKLVLFGAVYEPPDPDGFVTPDIVCPLLSRIEYIALEVGELIVTLNVAWSQAGAL